MLPESYSLGRTRITRATTTMRLRHHLLRYVLSPLLALLAAHAAAAEGTPGLLPVIELFTSQGCSSCPTADALLGEYARRTDVMALSMPVDYWDYLGWKDTLASPIFTSRQRAYANARGDGKIYTPQVVVNGTAHCVGSHKQEIDRAIDQTAKALSGHHVPLSVHSDGLVVTVEAGPTPEQGGQTGGTGLLAVVGASAPGEIQRREERRRKNTYHNKVRELLPVGN